MFGDIDEATLNIIHRGLETSKQALMDDVGVEPENGQPTSPEGKVPYEPVGDQIPREDSDDLPDPTTDEGGVAEVDEANMDFIEYSAKQLKGVVKMTSGQKMAWDQFDQRRAAETMADKSQDKANFKVDILYANVLRSTNLNQEILPATAYTNEQADPPEHIERMHNETMGGELMIVGPGALTKMKSIPAVQDLLASNQGKSESAILEAIADYVEGIERVIKFQKYYNQKPKNSPSNDIKQLFYNYIWVGHEQDILRIDLDHPDNPREDLEESSNPEVATFNYTRRVVPKRPNKKLGAIADVTATS